MAVELCRRLVYIPSCCWSLKRTKLPLFEVTISEYFKSISFIPLTYDEIVYCTPTGKERKGKLSTELEDGITNAVSQQKRVKC